MSKIAEILSVGTELLLGNIVNTNAQFLSQELSALGINVYHHTVVGDNYDRLAEAVRTARERSDILITTGGLGPTYDDITKEAVAESYGKKLVLHEPTLERIYAFFKTLGVTPTPNNERQAMLPEGCTVFENGKGTAPGCAVESEGKYAILLPGPPSECIGMYRTGVKPFLEKLSDAVLVSRNIRIFGMGESIVEDRLSKMMTSMTNPTIAPYATEGEVMLRVTAKAQTEAQANILLDPVVGEIRESLGSVIYGIDVESLEEAVFHLLQEHGLTLSSAESCTGGLFSARLTDIPGASQVYKGSVIAYTNEVKTHLLNVPEELIGMHGAVSEPVVLQMAAQVRALMQTDIGVAISGVAGPAGSEAKPVGTVCLAIDSGMGTFSYTARLRMGRSRIRTAAVNRALDLVRRQILKLPLQV